MIKNLSLMAFWLIVLALFTLWIYGCGTDVEDAEVNLLEAPSAPSVVMDNCPTSLYKNTSRMRYVPSGSFAMGGAWDTDHHKTPEWTAETPAFYIDTHEVTIGDFLYFVDMTGYPLKDSNRYFDIETHERSHFNRDVRPITQWEFYALPAKVTWYEAVAYATWIGKRLPSEVEWEKAARAGKSGGVAVYGNYYYATLRSANQNLWDTGFTFRDMFSVKSVGSYAPNNYGLFDMIGNVDEWCLDVWNTHAYLLLMNDMELNPTDCRLNGSTYFTKDQNIRVVRGGGIRHNPDMVERYASSVATMDVDKQADFLKSTIHVGERGALPAAIFTTGFRCVLPVGKDWKSKSWLLCQIK